jgi:DNA-binding NarL/FixJ family response regulator
MNDRISVLLADDHGLMREALSAWLQTTGDIAVVACAANAQEALSQAMHLRPDIVLMDIEMPGSDCFQVAQMIRTKCPGCQVVFLSAFHSDRYIDLALAVRASGYVVKTEVPSIIADAIRAVASGKTYFSREVEDRIIVGAGGLRLGSDAQSRASALTPREVEILRYVARGHSNKEIALITAISFRTVERHIANAMRRLDFRTRVELTRFAIQEGLATTQVD